MRKKRGTDYYVNRHSCFLLQYHLVLVTKYRHPVLTGPVREVVYERVRYVADSRGSDPGDKRGGRLSPHPDGGGCSYFPGGTCKCDQDPDRKAGKKTVRGNTVKKILLETLFLV